MTDEKFSLKKYNDYPVIVDNECLFVKGRECEKGNDKCIYVLNTQCRIKEEVKE